MALTDPPFFCHGCQAATAIHGAPVRSCLRGAQEPAGDQGRQIHFIPCNHWRVLLRRTNNNLYGFASHLSHNARKMMQGLLVHCKALVHRLELWDEEQRSYSSCQSTTSLINFQV